MNRWLFLLYILVATYLLLPTPAAATHNRAGEISYTSQPLPDQPYRYRFTITTYTKTGGDSEAADRDTLEIDFGDGSPKGYAPRTNGGGNGVEIEDNIRWNIYQITHTYPGTVHLCGIRARSQPNPRHHQHQRW